VINKLAIEIRSLKLMIAELCSSYISIAKLNSRRISIIILVKVKLDFFLIFFISELLYILGERHNFSSPVHQMTQLELR